MKGEFETTSLSLVLETLWKIMESSYLLASEW